MDEAGLLNATPLPLLLLQALLSDMFQKRTSPTPTDTKPLSCTRIRQCKRTGVPAPTLTVPQQQPEPGTPKMKSLGAQQRRRLTGPPNPRVSIWSPA